MSPKHLNYFSCELSTPPTHTHRIEGTVIVTTRDIPPDLVIPPPKKYDDPPRNSRVGVLLPPRILSR